jgi:hypothetical protein
MGEVIKLNPGNDVVDGLRALADLVESGEIAATEAAVVLYGEDTMSTYGLGPASDVFSSFYLLSHGAKDLLDQS